MLRIRRRDPTQGFRKRALLFVLRRRTCQMTAIANAVLCIVLLMSSMLIIKTNEQMIEEMVEGKRKRLIRKSGIQKELYNEYMPFAGSAKCGAPSSYVFKGNDLDHEECFEDLNGFMHRGFNITEAQAETCSAYAELIPCRNATNFEESPLLDKFPQCAGFTGTWLFYNASANERVYAPSMTNEDLAGRTLIPAQFMVMCPICWPSSTFSDSRGSCARDLMTLREGWPNFARYCDVEQEHRNPAFCKIKNELLMSLE